ncbi:MAG: hypothetical protein L0215_08255, partial [Gemmataceae bacterium]|nr:hypothetical protein [Gemmataceae bacterium]
MDTEENRGGDHPHEIEAGNQPDKPDAVVDVTSILAAYSAEVLHLIDLPSMPLDNVDFELQRIPERTQGMIFRLVVHVRKMESNDALPGKTEIGTLPVDIRQGRIGAIVLSEDDRELLDEKRKLMPARTRLLRAWQLLMRLWERWSYSDRPNCLKIADIKEILRRHEKEKKEGRERGQLSMMTLGEFWKAGGMLVELLNSHYGHLGANEREKLEIRRYLLEKAG